MIVENGLSFQKENEVRSEFIMQSVGKVNSDRTCLAENCTVCDFRKRRNWKASYFFMLFQLSRACSSVRQKDHAATGQIGLLGTSVQIQ